MTDDDIHAFGAPTPPPAATPARQAPRIGRWLAAGAFVFLLLAAAVGALAWTMLAEAVHEGLSVVINGDAWAVDEFDGAHAMLGLLGVGLALLIVLLVVTLVVPLSLLVGLLAAALGLGVGLLAMLLVAGFALSPLWLILLVLWLLLRRKRAPAATMTG